MIKGTTIRLMVWAERALFTNPEMKIEKHSYLIPTPSACIGLLSKIHWKPEFKFKLLQIDVLHPFTQFNMMINGIKSKVPFNSIKSTMKNMNPLYLNAPKNRTQYRITGMKDVRYILYFQIEASTKEETSKQQEIFLRRARNGACFAQPYMGCKEFPAHFKLLKKSESSPTPINLTIDFGLMLYNFDYRFNPPPPKFFHAKLNKGILDLRNVEVL